MLHAFYLMNLELRCLQIDRVDDVLDSFSISLLPGKRVGLEYPASKKQILELDLNFEKMRLAELSKPKPKIKKAKIKIDKKRKS